MTEKERDSNAPDSETPEAKRNEAQYYADLDAYQSELPENAQGKSSTIPPSDPRATAVVTDGELLRRDRATREAGLTGTDEHNQRVLDNPDPHEDVA